MSKYTEKIKNLDFNKNTKALTTFNNVLKKMQSEYQNVLASEFTPEKIRDITVNFVKKNKQYDYSEHGEFDNFFSIQISALNGMRDYLQSKGYTKN